MTCKILQFEEQQFPHDPFMESLYAPERRPELLAQVAALVAPAALAEVSTKQLLWLVEVIEEALEDEAD